MQVSELRQRLCCAACAGACCSSARIDCYSSEGFASWQQRRRPRASDNKTWWALLWHVQLVPIFDEFFSNKKTQKHFEKKTRNKNLLFIIYYYDGK
jgi:hypothetical protein